MGRAPIVGPLERAGDLMCGESLQRVVELFPGPALVVGPDGEVLGCNEPAGRWLGPVAGRALSGLVVDPPGRVAGFLEECARTGRKVAGELTPIRSGGGAVGGCRVEGIAVPDRSGGGPTAVVIHVVEGGPEEGPVGALREEVRRKDEFLDRLAHDLRNPVAAISTTLHLARKATAAEDVAWAEEAMERQVKQLVRQLDDLLDLTRIGRGRLSLERRRLDGAAAARAAAAAARPIIEGRDLQLTLTTSPGDLSVTADPARLEQMLVGLLDHVAGSIEPGGRIRLAVARDRDVISFRVADRSDAPGPSTAHAPAWEWGLGPMLIRDLAEMHGGSACVLGPENGAGGPEFTICLPADDPDGPAPASPARASKADGFRILVVDDNDDAARGAARLLQISGHDVRIAHDGRQALEIAAEFRPRFFLLDIGLPGMDGYEVARQLRGDPLHREATIIAVSGYSVDEYREPHTAGFDHHLVKPIDYEVLRAILARHTATT